MNSPRGRSVHTPRVHSGCGGLRRRAPGRRRGSRSAASALRVVLQFGTVLRKRRDYCGDKPRADGQEDRDGEEADHLHVERCAHCRMSDNVTRQRPPAHSSHFLIRAPLATTHTFWGASSVSVSESEYGSAITHQCTVTQLDTCIKARHAHDQTTKSPSGLTVGSLSDLRRTSREPTSSRRASVVKPMP